MRFRYLFFAAALFLFIISSSSALATTAEDECFFNWVEPQYPAFVAPAGSPSQSMPPYYFRYYSATNSYLGINSADQNLYYLGSDGQMLNLGSYAQWKALSGCQTSSEISGPDDISNMLNQAFGLTETATNSGLTDQIEPLLFAFLGMPSTCPIVATNLDLASMSSLEDINSLLTTLPDPITAQLNYGSGCRVTPDGPLMSGSADMTVNNFNLNPSTGLISAQFQLVANQLKENSTLLANGSMSGNLSINAENFTGSASINLNNFQTATDGVANGTATLNLLSETSYNLSIDIADGVNVDVDLDLSMVAQTDDRYVINTINNTGSINQYTVVFNSIIFDSAVCEDYPVGGSAIFSSGGQNWTVTFNSSCNGNYTIQ